MARGGAREGAGRPKKGAEAEIVESIAATLVEMAIGQSNVSIDLDSKGQVKPAVSVYHREISKAGKLAEAEFDRLMDKYNPRPKAAAPTSMDAFTDEDLKLLGLQRIQEAKCL